MDFTALKTRVANETGLDVTADATVLGTWVNAAYQHISGLANWEWLFTQGTIQTKADITTGTATINSGSTSLTLSSGPTVSVANQWMINFPDVSQDWYFISAHTANSTSATLSVAFAGTSNLSAGSYTLRKVLYSLPTDLDRIIDVRQQISSVKMLNVDPRTFDRLMPDPTATGNPIYYMFLGLDTSKVWQIGLFPTPESILNLQIKYYKKITELSSGSDEPLIPAKWHDSIVYAALYLFGHPYIDDSRFAAAKTRYEMTIADMKTNLSHVPDSLTVVQPWDSRAVNTLRRPRYPSNYPEAYGGL